MNEVLKYLIENYQYIIGTVITILALFVAYESLIQSNARLEIIPEYSKIDVDGKRNTIVKFKIMNTGQKTAYNISFIKVKSNQSFFRHHYLITKYDELKKIMYEFEKVEKKYENEKIELFKEIVLEPADKLIYENLNEKMISIFKHKNSGQLNKNGELLKKVGFLTKSDVIYQNLEKVYLDNNEKKFYIDSFFNSNIALIPNASDTLIHFTDVNSFIEYESSLLYDDIEIELKYQEIKKINVFLLLFSIITLTILSFKFLGFAIFFILTVITLNLITITKRNITKKIDIIKKQKNKTINHQIISKLNKLKRKLNRFIFISDIINLMCTKIEMDKMRMIKYKSILKTVVMHSKYFDESNDMKNQIARNLKKVLDEKNGKDFFNSFYVQTWISSLHKSELKEFNEISRKNKHNVRLYIKSFDEIKNNMLKQKYYDLLELIKELDFISSNDQWECRQRVYSRNK